MYYKKLTIFAAAEGGGEYELFIFTLKYVME